MTRPSNSLHRPGGAGAALAGELNRWGSLSHDQVKAQRKKRSRPRELTENTNEEDTPCPFLESVCGPGEPKNRKPR